MSTDNHKSMRARLKLFALVGHCHHFLQGRGGFALSPGRSRFLMVPGFLWLMAFVATNIIAYAFDVGVGVLLLLPLG